MITFQNSIFLILIPILFFLYLYFKKEKSWFNYPNNIITKYCITPKIIFFTKIIQFFIIAIFCIIISGPSITIPNIKISQEKNHIMLILDISKSMLAEDMQPNRITVAKNSINNFLIEQKNNIFSLIVFAGKPFNIISNSNDIDGISNFINSISPNYINQEKIELSGTNIWDSLLLAFEKLKKIEEQKYIILITDWSSNIWSNPIEWWEILAKNNIPIYTIWLWKDDNQPLFYTGIDWKKNFFYDPNWEKIIGEFDKKLLQNLSEKSSWKFFESDNIDSLNEIFEKINSENAKKIEEKLLQKISITPFLLLLIIALIFLENFLTKKYFYYYKIWQ